MNQLFMRPVGFLSVLVLMIAVVFTDVLAFDTDDDSSVEVECYRRDRWGDDYQWEDVGHISAYPNQRAAQNCNRSYYACRNRCIACVYDYQYADEVCEYPNGKRFLK